MNANGDSSLILDHLKRSFTVGDAHYEAQFWYARELFLQSHFTRSGKVFAELHERAPGRFRTRSTAPALKTDGTEIIYEGQIERLEEGYAFLRIAQFSNALFASRSDSAHDDWESLRNGSSILTSVAFSRRGARAINVTIA